MNTSIGPFQKVEVVHNIKLCNKNAMNDLYNMVPNTLPPVDHLLGHPGVILVADLHNLLGVFSSGLNEYE
jgi:hypothetical protein